MDGQVSSISVFLVQWLIIYLTKQTKLKYSHTPDTTSVYTITLTLEMSQLF